ncbi:MAG: hypothetical protein JJE53_02505 [Candidatus Pacebacteria bacterium]|nr:hypothetical protein [Candidatus Paceibacterota bacterium]
MKKYFFLAILVTVLVIISCNPDDDPFIPPPPPPPPVELAPTVKLTLSSSSILYSTDVVVTWTSINAKSVSINGESMTSTSGSKTYSGLIVSTTFTALATNVVKTATDSKTVTVGEEATPTIELNISSANTTLPYGNNVTVTWNITNFKTATLNGEAITATGLKEVHQLLKDSIFTIVATNFTKSATTTKTVTVGDWTSSRFGMITHGYWRNTRYGWWRTDGVFLDEMPRDAALQSEQWFFSKDFTYQVYHPDGTNSSYGYNPWSLDADPTHFIWGTFVYTIVELTETSFIVSRDVLWGTPEIHVNERYIFER